MPAENSGARETCALMSRVFSLSLVAAIIIEYLLITGYLHGVDEIFSPPNSVLFVPLALIAFQVYRYLRRFVVAARWPTENLLPPGIAGSLAAFLLTLSPATRGFSIALISVVYLAELAVGVRLYSDISFLTKTGSLLFVAGMAGFILSLPMAALYREAFILPIVFNVVKSVGLSMLLARSRSAWCFNAARQAALHDNS